MHECQGSDPTHTHRETNKLTTKNEKYSAHVVDYWIAITGEPVDEGATTAELKLGLHDGRCGVEGVRLLHPLNTAQQGRRWVLPQLCDVAADNTVSAFNCLPALSQLRPNWHKGKS
jgi:hypothetical protein